MEGGRWGRRRSRRGSVEDEEGGGYSVAIVIRGEGVDVGRLAYIQKPSALWWSGSAEQTVGQVPLPGPRA